MATYTIRPSSVIGAGTGSYTSTGAATFLASISDNSDASYANNTGGGGVLIQDFGLAAASVPSTEFIARVGSSIRYKGQATPYAYMIGCGVYRSTDTPALFTFQPTNNATITSIEIAQTAVTWANSEANSARLRWYDGRYTTSTSSTNTYELFGTIYTLAPGSVTVPNTYSTLPTPVIAVQPAVTIGWEASVGPSNLRKVTTEVRIETGGTGVGTGTLVATGSIDNYFNATTTSTWFSVTLNAVVPNGTHKIYSRNLRYRDDGVVRSDQYGSWSAAGTLTQSYSPPNTPTLSVSPNQTTDIVTATVTPVTSAGYTSPTIDLQRSDDGGSTWSAVRNGTGVSGTFGTGTPIIDYEAPRGQTENYRARVNATVTPTSTATVSTVSGSGSTVTYTTTAAHPFNVGQVVSITGVNPAAYNLSNVTIATVPTSTTFTVTNTATGAYVSGGSISATVAATVRQSAWSGSATATINVDTWNLKAPLTPSLNAIDLNIIDKPNEELIEDIGVFRPLDRRYPVVVAGVLSGWDGDLQLVTTTSAEWTTVQKLLEAQAILLLESPFGWSKYIRIVSGAKVQLAGTITTPRRYVTVSYVQTQAP